MSNQLVATGVRVRDTRKSKGMSAATLAEVAHVAPNTVSSIENGRPVRPANMKSVLDALGIEDVSTLGESAYPDDVWLAMTFLGEFIMTRPARKREIEVAVTKFLIDNFASAEGTSSDEPR